MRIDALRIANRARRRPMTAQVMSPCHLGGKIDIGHATEFAVMWSYCSYACAAATYVLTAGQSNNRGTTEREVGLVEGIGEPRVRARPAAGGPAAPAREGVPGGKMAASAGAGSVHTHNGRQMSRPLEKIGR